MTLYVEKLAVEVGQLLHQQHLLLATAESCTGGGLAYWLTSVEGSSHWFERGFVTYSNQAKQDLLAVQQQTLATHGAVSEETAREMAAGALRHSKAGISVAITGIAGPTGGSPQKPVGTVWIAWAKREGPTRAEVSFFSGDRQTIRTRAIEVALQKLVEFIY